MKACFGSSHSLTSASTILTGLERERLSDPNRVEECSSSLQRAVLSTKHHWNVFIFIFLLITFF